MITYITLATVHIFDENKKQIIFLFLFTVALALLLALLLYTHTTLELVLRCTCESSCIYPFQRERTTKSPTLRLFAGLFETAAIFTSEADLDTDLDTDLDNGAPCLIYSAIINAISKLCA